MKTKKLKVLDLKKTTITVLKNPGQIIGGTGGNPFRRTWQEPTQNSAPRTTSNTGPGTTSNTGPGTTSNTHPTG